MLPAPHSLLLARNELARNQMARNELADCAGQALRSGDEPVFWRRPSEFYLHGAPKANVSASTFPNDSTYNPLCSACGGVVTENLVFV